MVNQRSQCSIRQTGFIAVEYAYVLVVIVIMVVGVSGLMKRPIADFMGCASQKIAEFVIGQGAACFGTNYGHTQMSELLVLPSKIDTFVLSHSHHEVAKLSVLTVPHKAATPLRT